MMLARVLGTLTATEKHAGLVGRRVVLLQPLELDLTPSGAPYYAMGTQQAGPGDLVLAVREGGAARMLTEAPDAPIHAAIVGLVEALDLNP